MRSLFFYRYADPSGLAGKIPFRFRTKDHGKIIAEGMSQIFLNNKLIVILPEDNPAGLENLEDLANAGVKIVLAAEEVPVGNYARQALDLMNNSFGADFKNLPC